MAVTDFTCNKDARVAVTGSTEMGSGTSSGLPFGTYSGYKYRVLLGFSVNMAGWTSITSAILNYKSSNQIHVAFGSDPTFVAHRIQASWSEGSSSGLSTGNAVIYPGPSAAAANAVQEDAPTGENTWGAVDVTAMMRDVLNGAPFYGIRLIGTDNSSVESGSASNVGEIYSRESGSGTAYLRITYETNRAPNAPTVDSPGHTNGGLAGTDTPTFNVTMTDPDGNAINNYNWQIDDNADFSSPIQDVYGGAAGASGVTVAVVPAALPRGGTYYFRARAADVSVWGGWSTTFQLKIASYPTLTVSEPSASGRLARLQYDAGSGWGSPRMLVNWNMTCPDGGSQATWRVEVVNDSGGNPTGSSLDNATANDTTSTRIIPANLIEGNYYHVRVTATCSHGLTSVVGWTRVRARWGVAVYGWDTGATPIGSLTLSVLDVTDETTGGQGRVVMEYQTMASDGLPSSWAGTIGGAGLARYFRYRVWLLTWGASPTVSPTLNQLNITYTTAIITPDKWSVNDSNNVSGDVSSFVYGTKSLRMKGVGNWLTAHQQIAVVPNTYYVLSGRIQTSGPVTIAYLGFASNSTGGGELSIAEIDKTKAVAFENPASRVFTAPWFSGSNTSVWVRLSSYAPVGTSVWYDAIKAEASSVVTPWSPGYVANAVVLDAGGMQIDASNGGIFRLRGSAGGARDVVELGAAGLVFGGDTGMSSPAPGRMQVGGTEVFLSDGQSFPNMVPNGGFRNGLLGWGSNIGGDTTATFTFWTPSDTAWALPDGDIDHWKSGGARGSTVAIFSSNTGAYGPYINSSPIPVFAGETYSASVLLGLHRVPRADLTFWWYDYTGNYIGGNSASMYIAGTGQGGANRSGWNRLVNEGVVAPPGATYVYLAITMQTPYTDGGNQYLFIDQVQMNVGKRAGVFSGSPKTDNLGGAVFPTNGLLIGTRFFRTDLRMEFFWDGTRWLSTTLYTLPIPMQTAVEPMSATNYLRMGNPHPTLSLWVEQFWANVYVSTTNNASNYWTLACFNATLSTAGAALTTVTQLVANINAVFPVGGTNWIQATETRVGTAGTLYGNMMFSYRLVGP